MFVRAAGSSGLQCTDVLCPATSTGCIPVELLLTAPSQTCRHHHRPLHEPRAGAAYISLFQTATRMHVKTCPSVKPACMSRPVLAYCTNASYSGVYGGCSMAPAGKGLSSLCVCLCAAYGPPPVCADAVPAAGYIQCPGCALQQPLRFQREGLCGPLQPGPPRGCRLVGC